jgi:hypothetical protein
MSFTYSPTLATNRDKVRFALSDTTSPGKLSDEEIAGLIVSRGTWEGAVADGWRRFAGDVARFGKDYANEKGSETQSSFAEHCMTMVRDWERRHMAAIESTTTLPLAVVGSIGPAPFDPDYLPTG